MKKSSTASSPHTSLETLMGVEQKTVLFLSPIVTTGVGTMAIEPLGYRPWVLFAIVPAP